MQEALLSLLLLQHLVVAMWQVRSHGLEREAVLALRTDRKRGARAQGCLGQGVRAGTRLALVTVCLWAQSQAATGRNTSMICSTRPSRDLKPPGRQGANTAKLKPSPITPQPGFWGTAWEQGEPLHSLRHPGTLPAVAPLRRGTADAHSPGGEAALPRSDLPPRASGVAGG